MRTPREAALAVGLQNASQDSYMHCTVHIYTCPSSQLQHSTLCSTHYRLHIVHLRAEIARTVVTAIRLRSGSLENRRSIPSKRKFYLLSKAGIPAVQPTELPIQWEPGALLLRIKWPGREADLSP
jgi:hypothetical protein